MEALLASVSEAAVQVTAIRDEAGALKEIRQLASAISEYFSVSETPQNGAGALRIRAKAEQLLGSLARVEQGLVSAVERTQRELLESQERAHLLRVLPVEIIFPPLGRALHEIAEALGKQVELQTSGADVRLDADVLAVLQDALLQLVRNAAAHGIETPEIRAAAGNLHWERSKSGSNERLAALPVCAVMTERELIWLRSAERRSETAQLRRSTRSLWD